MQFWAHLHQSILFFGRSWWTNPLHSLCHSIVEEVLCHRQHGRLWLLYPYLVVIWSTSAPNNMPVCSIYVQMCAFLSYAWRVLSKTVDKVMAFSSTSGATDHIENSGECRTHLHFMQQGRFITSYDATFTPWKKLKHVVNFWYKTNSCNDIQYQYNELPIHQTATQITDLLNVPERILSHGIRLTQRSTVKAEVCSYWIHADICTHHIDSGDAFTVAWILRFKLKVDACVKICDYADYDDWLMYDC